MIANLRPFGGALCGFVFFVFVRVYNSFFPGGGICECPTRELDSGIKTRQDQHTKTPGARAADEKSREKKHSIIVLWSADSTFTTRPASSLPSGVRLSVCFRPPFALLETSCLSNRVDIALHPL